MTVRHARVIALAAVLVGIGARVPITRLHAQQPPAARPLEELRALAEQGDAGAQVALVTSADGAGVPQDERLRRDERDKVPSKGALFRVGLVGGLGVEYVRDINQRWQVAFPAATWVLFSEVGADIRYFLEQGSTTGYYVGSGVRLLNSPLLFDVALGYNVEVGFEKRSNTGSYFGVGVGGTLLYIPDGVSAEGHGFEGVVPSITFRVGKIHKTK